MTSSVRDRKYQAVLAAEDIEATRNFSQHTAGYAFDISRAYRSRKQAEAFQFMLDRLTALNLIAWVREPGAIHVTVSKAARSLVPIIGLQAASGQSSSSLTFAATASGVMPSLSSTSWPGAEAPKRSIATLASTHSVQPIETPASTDTDASATGSTEKR